MCTARCESDDDCETDPASPCRGGFTCAIATVISGAFCCQKVCICRDQLFNLPDGGSVPFPQGCVADDPKNECCNLAGRRENPDMYPACKSH